MRWALQPAGNALALWACLAALALTASAADPCECLNWKQVYESGRILCGEGLEFAFDFPFGPPKTYEFAYFAPALLGFTYSEFCGTFFKRMDNNYCVQVKHHTYDTTGLEAENWCYVSKKCRDLNGGGPVMDQQSIPELPAWLLSETTYKLAKLLYRPQVIKRDLSIKFCRSGKDALLGEMAPLEVMELAKRMDSVVGFVTKTAYPMARRNDARTPIWDEIKDAVTAGDVAKLPAIVRQAVEDKKPIVIDVDPEGHTHQRILVGKEVYELEHKCTEFGCGGAQWPFRRGRDMGEL
mmetsp:Transcript_76327/g.210686  ORF Transcript_76327/g.210686 Transcript_76327/m.210686 type:complete len:295 (+) Transcript_76327:57-941(+)|eukprot:CAMPEP_0179058182 /NCGR_PEP_ID=MMETSP0796-20121207/24718_1 /TAXON_ID=73915 /ORGANISM="Pyrodinium bahamense, Strain pbaha01" /LENGTH=294 /DNA_ID=CAMNT_0020754925 /DNA_START=53 /DNA_END=937 /DNA_ORIENTATION=-